MSSRRVVVITGAGGTLGAALSAQFAGEPDTDVVLSDVSVPSLEATVNGLPQDRGAVETLPADVSEVTEVEAVVALAMARFGRVDVLVSNAGVLSPNGRIHNLTTEDWERAFRVNVLGAVNGIRAAVPVMRGATVGIDRSDGLGQRTHCVVARRSVLRHEGRGDPTREGRGGRVRARRDPGELRVPRDVSFGDPRGPPSGGARHDRGQAPARAGNGGRSGRCVFVPRERRRGWTTGSAIVVDGGYAAP